MPDTNHLLDLIESIDGTQFEIPARPGRYLEFSVEEYRRRYCRACVFMDELGIDALLLSSSTSVRYFTGLQTWLWILPPVVPIVAILPRNATQATIVDADIERGGVRETTWVAEPTLYGGADDPIEVVRAAVEKRGLASARLGFELGPAQRPNLSPSDFQRLLSSFPQATIVDAAPVLTHVRMIKSDPEIDRLREATRLSQIGFQAALGALQPGITELELTRVAARAMLDAGCKPSAIPMTLIFLAGPERYRQVVQPAVDREIQPGEMVWLDGGCSVDGYRADFIRSGVIGHLSDNSEHWYDVAIESLEASLEAIGPGKPLGDAWTAAQDVFDRAGVGDKTLIPHQIGHSVGLDHWEMPLVTQPGTDFGSIAARPGMVLCIEPTIVGPDGDDEWHDGIFVAEDQIVVTDSGIEVLTKDIPRTLFRASTGVV